MSQSSQSIGLINLSDKIDNFRFKMLIAVSKMFPASRTLK